MKYRVGDTVIVIAGRDRGAEGVITRILKKENRVIVEGVNKRIKHVKGRGDTPGERVEFFAPIHISNIAIKDPKDGKPSRVGYRFEEGVKIRYAKRSGEPLPTSTTKKVRGGGASTSSKEPKVIKA